MYLEKIIELINKTLDEGKKAFQRFRHGLLSGSSGGKCFKDENRRPKSQRHQRNPKNSAPVRKTKNNIRKKTQSQEEDEARDYQSKKKSI